MVTMDTYQTLNIEQWTKPANMVGFILDVLQQATRGVETFVPQSFRTFFFSSAWWFHINSNKAALFSLAAHNFVWI